MLVWDSFRAHITDPVKNVATKMKTDPGDLTSLMQPLDVSLNKPCKDRMKSQWNDWMLSGKEKLTAGGNLAKPDLPTVVHSEPNKHFLLLFLMLFHIKNRRRCALVSKKTTERSVFGSACKVGQRRMGV